MNLMIKKSLISIIFVVFFANISFALSDEKEKKHCSGFAKWKNGEFVQIRESKCITESEYQSYLNSPDYLVNIIKNQFGKSLKESMEKNNTDILRKNYKKLKHSKKKVRLYVKLEN